MKTEEQREYQKKWYRINRKRILDRMATQRKIAKDEKKYKLYLQLKKEFENDTTF